MLCCLSDREGYGSLGNVVWFMAGCNLRSLGGQGERTPMKKFISFIGLAREIAELVVAVLTVIHLIIQLAGPAINYRRRPYVLRPSI